MMYTELSPKQLESMLWWAWEDTKNHDAIIGDGSVRSGKTMSMTIGFVLWSMKNFNGENFAFCGKTVSSLIRNVVTPMDESSYQLIQGITLAGILLDEDCVKIFSKYYW